MTIRFADDIERTHPASSTALVTIAGGERYLRCWNEVARPTWTAYAERHGIDIVLVRFPLDRSGRVGEVGGDGRGGEEGSAGGIHGEGPSGASNQ